MKLCVLDCLFSVFVITNASKCATPDSKEGECMLLKDCPVLSSYLEKKLWSTEDLKFFRRSRCLNSNDTMCCEVSNKTLKFELPPKSVPPVFLDFRINDSENGLPSACGEQIYEDDQRIIGEPAALGEFPWVALLKFNSSQGVGYACGGALINTKYVLTAAHCVSGIHGKPFEVTLGEYNINSIKDCNLDNEDDDDCAPPPQTIAVENILQHDYYSPDTPGKPHDIALIRLAKSTVYTDYIKPICICTPELQEVLLKPRMIMRVAGWGETRNGPHSNVKMKASIPVVDRKTCSKTKTYKVLETQLCAGGGSEDSCAGDSGGPLMAQELDPDGAYRWYMTGIVSQGPTKCATRDVPGVYTNVASYIDWIKSNLKP